MGLRKKKTLSETSTEFQDTVLYWAYLMNKANTLQGTEASKEPCEQKTTFSSLLSGNRSEQ